MPSQEDYLDKLLNDLNGGSKEEAVAEEASEETLMEESEEQQQENSLMTDMSALDELLSVEYASDITAEEETIVEQSERTEAAENETAENKPFDEMDDIMSILSKTDDAELQEIHDLLQKSDNHEKIIDDIENIDDSEGLSEASALAEAVKSDEAGELSAEEKQAELEAKKAEKEAKRAAAKAEREAKREALKAEKAEKKLAAKGEREAKRAAAKLRKEEERAAKAALKDAEAEANRVAEELAEENRMAAEAEMAAEDKMPDGQEETSEAPQDESFLQAFDDSSDISALFAGVDNISEDENEEAEVYDMPELDKLAEAGKEKNKKGFFARFIDFLTEEDEEEENEEIKLSDENRDILQEMDKEEGKKKGKKKKGKAKETEASEEGDNASDKAPKEKKPKKEKKQKKEKAPKLEDVEAPQKKLSKKKVSLIMIICLSIGFAVLIIANVLGDFAIKREGRAAYYQGDYQTCYQNLFGKELNESEQVMYSKSESILRIRLWLREYEMFAEDGKNVEALDSLIQSVHDYPVLYHYSEQWNAADEVSESYAEILNILSEKYHLTEEQAREISEIPDDVEYTIAVTEIAGGTSYENWRYGGDEPEEEELLDILPEENEFGENDFVDNMETIDDSNN